MKPVSFRGFALNANGLSSRFDRSFQRPSITPISVRREGNRPLIAAVEREAWSLPDLGMLIDGDAAVVDTLRLSLLKAFDTAAGPGALIISDEDGTNERHIMAVCTVVTQKKGDSGDGFVATLVAADDVFWRPVLPSNTSTVMNASPKTITVTNSGDVDAYPTIAIYESGGISGDSYWRYRRFVPIKWTAGGVTDYPCELTNGGLNTTALISAGKLHDSLSTSLGVIADGRHIDRWYAAANGSAGGYNSTTTRVWANLDFKAGVSTTTVEYYPGSGDELFVADVSGFPTSGIIQVDNELFLYDGIDYYRKSFKIAQKAAHGSTSAVHSYGATVYWIQHEVWLVYASSATHPLPTSDAKKPVFNLSTSSNAVWKWADFGSLTSPERPGRWTAMAGGTGQTFTGYQHGAETDPFQVMGIVRPGAGSTLPTNFSFWQIYSPAGIATIDWTGSVKTDFGFVRLDGSADGVEWTVASQAYDATVDGTWAAFSDILTGRPASWRYLRFVPWNVTGHDVEGQIESLEITFQSALAPTSTMQPEQNNYQVNILFENLTTGESLRVAILPGIQQATDTAVINTETMEAMILPGRGNVWRALSRDRLRRDLLRLAPGANSIRITETPYANNTIGFIHHRRQYL